MKTDLPFLSMGALAGLLLVLQGCCCCCGGEKGPCEIEADACYDDCNSRYTVFSDDWQTCFENCAFTHISCGVDEAIDQ